MPAVTGTLKDANLQSLAPFAPRLVFTLSDTSTSGASSLLSTRPVVVTPAANGDFTVELAATETMNQSGRFYTFHVEYLDAASNFIKIEFPDWKLFVPVGGGTIGALIPGFGSNPYMVYWQPLKPTAWPVGAVWVNTVSGDINRKKA